MVKTVMEEGGEYQRTPKRSQAFSEYCSFLPSFIYQNFVGTIYHVPSLMPGTRETDE